MTVYVDGAAAAAPDPAGLDGPTGAAQGLVQLLTPEGERVEHPRFPLELSVDEIRALYRDLVLVRRIDTEAGRAAAPGRARHLGVAAGPGSRADRLGPCARRRATWSSRPTVSMGSPGAAGWTR